MSINEKVTDGIEVSEWSHAALYDRGRLAFARELRDMLDAEPEPAYSQREVLVIQTAAQFAAIDDSTDDFNLCIASARRMLDAFDASREAKP